MTKKEKEQYHKLISGFQFSKEEWDEMIKALEDKHAQWQQAYTSAFKDPIPYFYAHQTLSKLSNQARTVATQSSPNQIIAEFKRQQLSKFRLPLDEDISYAVVKRGARAYPVSSFVSGIFSVLPQSRAVDVEWYSYLSNLHHVIGLNVPSVLLDTYAFVEFETSVSHNGQFLKGFVVSFKDVYFV
jgi:hypothetical protein